MGGFIVHTISGSPFARAVTATLEEKGASWRIAPLAPGEHKLPAHLARHPFGRMPVIEHDGFILYETQAILRYIDRALPEPAMTPADPIAAARMDQAMNVNDWYLFRDCSAVIGFHRVVAPKLLGMMPDESAIAAAMPPSQTVFRELSRLLDGRAYFAGPVVSLADMIIAPQLDFLSVTPEWESLTSGRENITAWLARMRARPSFQSTAWEKLAGEVS
jgi:glutathione S-transferase